MTIATFPASVTDVVCPQEHVVVEPQDRRLLWHIESALSVNATTDYQRHLRLAIYRYLCETCEHHWHDDPTGYGGAVPPYRQCLWCNIVEPPTPPEEP